MDDGAIIFFLWIPGQSGIIGNERADASTKRAINLRQITNIAVNQQQFGLRFGIALQTFGNIGGEMMNEHTA